MGRFGAGTRGLLVAQSAKAKAYTAHAIDFKGETVRAMRLQSSFSTQIAPFVLAAALIGGIAHAQSTNQEQQIVIPQGESTIVLEPYAPNVIRVTLSPDKAEAMAAPGYGIEAKPMPAGWTYQEGESARTYRSSRIVVTLLGEGSSGKGAADAAPK